MQQAPEVSKSYAAQQCAKLLLSLLILNRPACLAADFTATPPPRRLPSFPAAKKTFEKRSQFAEQRGSLLTAVRDDNGACGDLVFIHSRNLSFKSIWPRGRVYCIILFGVRGWKIWHSHSVTVTIGASFHDWLPLSPHLNSVQRIHCGHDYDCLSCSA